MKKNNITKTKIIKTKASDPYNGVEYQLMGGYNDAGEMINCITRHGDEDFLLDIVDDVIARQVFFLLEQDVALYLQSHT